MLLLGTLGLVQGWKEGKSYAAEADGGVERRPDGEGDVS
jgi:hypothetical protein